MPKVEVINFGDNTEVVFSPAEGDVRCMMAGGIERYQNGCWNYIGDLNKMFNDVIQLQSDTTKLQSFMWDQNAKDSEAYQMGSLEEKFDDLKEAGEYLRQLEKMVRVARKAYTKMGEATKEKLKTFERLDKPYPDQENEDQPV